MAPPVLPEGLPRPVPAADGLDGPYWEGTRAHELRVQRCASCQTWRQPPEWICHVCHSRDSEWVAVEPRGVLFASERVWHPVHPALAPAVPYVVVLVALPHAGGVRVVGNLLGDPRQDVPIGSPLRAVFEDHEHPELPYTLVHWQPS